MMRISRLGVFALLMIAVGVGSSCGFYNRIMARKNLVDGANAYKNRKFDEAEALFRYAASLDPNGDTVEGRTAQLSLARTLHSAYIGDRGNKGKADAALKEYNKALPQSLRDLKETSAAYNSDPNKPENQSRYFQSLSAVNSTSSAIAGLYDALDDKDKAKAWLEEVAANADYPATARARAFSSLASKQNTCANEISDTEATKKTVTGKDGKQIYQFIKPANTADFDKLKQCTADGVKLIDQALALEPELVKSAPNAKLADMSDVQLALLGEQVKVFESVKSYKSALTGQQMRIAEMDGNAAERDRLKGLYDSSKADYQKLSDVVKNIEALQEERAAAKEAAEKGESNSANTNSNANKK